MVSGEPNGEPVSCRPDLLTTVKESLVIRLPPAVAGMSRTTETSRHNRHTRQVRPAGLQVAPRCRPASEPRDTPADLGVELLQRHRSAETPSATARQAHPALAELAPSLSTRSPRQVHQILRPGNRHAQAFDLSSQNAAALVPAPTGRAGRPSTPLNSRPGSPRARHRPRHSPKHIPNAVPADRAARRTTALAAMDARPVPAVMRRAPRAPQHHVQVPRPAHLPGAISGRASRNAPRTAPHAAPATAFAHRTRDTPTAPHAR
jgi:hypothetical protein